MATLAELQAAVRDAVVASDDAEVGPMLVGGADPVWRLSVHRRHYHASLVEAIVNRYPATQWLIGDAVLTPLARRYVIEHPPRVFCVAEFGEGFPKFLATEASLAALPYLRDFATLEWHVGKVSVAVSNDALTMVDLAATGASALMLSTVVLQPGVAYLSTDWPVDALLRFYLCGDAPAQFEIQPRATHVEVSGSRGALNLEELPPSIWHFRRELQSGRTIAMAAEVALEIDARFDPGRGLLDLCDRGLLVRRE